MKKCNFAALSLGDMNSVKLSMIGTYEKDLVNGTFNALLVPLYNNDFRSIIDMNF
jgi:hypothetical protein